MHRMDAIAWVMGSEGEGMRRLTRESCDLLVRIRQMRGSRADAITMSDTHRVTGVEVESYDEKVDG